MDRSRTQHHPRWVLKLLAVMAVAAFLAGLMDLIDGGHGWSIALVFVTAFPTAFVCTWIQAITDHGPDTRRVRILKSTSLGLGILSTLAGASCVYEGIMGTVGAWKAGLGVLVCVGAVLVVRHVRRLDTMARRGSTPRPGEPPVDR